MRLIPSVLAICVASSLAVMGPIALQSPSNASAIDSGPIMRSESEPVVPSASIAESAATALTADSRSAVASEQASGASHKATPKPRKTWTRGPHPAVRHVARHIPAPHAARPVLFERSTAESAMGVKNSRCTVITCPRFVLLGVGY